MTIGLIVAGATFAAGAAQAGVAQEQRVVARKAAQRKFVHEGAQIAAGLQSESEVAAEQVFELARQEAVAKGTVRASGLGENSVRALSRSVGFEFGQDKATVQKNFETARTEARTQLAISHAERNATYESIGDTGGGQLALDLGIAAVAAAAAGATAGLAAVPTAMAPAAASAAPVAAPVVGGGFAAPAATQPAATSGLVGFGGAPPVILV
jgi:hypothetical protein